MRGDGGQDARAMTLQQRLRFRGDALRHHGRGRRREDPRERRAHRHFFVHRDQFADDAADRRAQLEGRLVRLAIRDEVAGLDGVADADLPLDDRDVLVGRAGADRFEDEDTGIARHLAQPAIGLPELNGITTPEKLAEKLAAGEALTLQRATTEALAYLSYLKRYAPKKENDHAE